MVLDKLKDAVRKFLTGSNVYEKAVNDFLNDLTIELIRSDVNVKVVANLTERIRNRLNNEKPPSMIERKEWFISIVYDELVKLFGGDKEPDVFPNKFPYIILLVGVQGSGKTTTAGKLALFYKEKGYKVALVGADVYRPAALDQLIQLGQQIKVPVYGEPGNQDAVKIAKNGIEKFLKEGYQIVIIDTAGRHGYGEEQKLLEEMKNIYDTVKPDEVMLVIDASIGQKAYALAQQFHQVSPIGSIIVTKLDGTAKGGGALSAVVATGATIKFIGTGEKLEDFEVFNPKRFISRILGMGDIETILEKIKSVQEYEEIQKKVEDALTGKGKLTLRDIYKQIITVRKMGPLRKVLQLVPGFSMLTIPDEQLKLSEEKMNKWLHIMDSMTYKELDDPSIIDRSRIRRIAYGAGVSPEDVKELLQYYDVLNKTLKNLRRRKDLGKLLFKQ